MLVPRTPHQPNRPTWDRLACGEPWPCAPGKVEYPPAVLVHVPECAEGSALPAVMASVLETVFYSYSYSYSYRFHFCFAEAGYHLATVTAVHVIRDGIAPMVTVERLDYRPHRYVPSDDQPADAHAVGALGMGDCRRGERPGT